MRSRVRARSWGWMRARTPLAAALTATGLLISGCSASGSSGGNSNVTATGNTLTIYLSVPANAASDPAVQDVVDAEKLAFSQLSGAAEGHVKLRLDPLTSTRLSDHARTAIDDTSAIAYLGELTPGASEDTAGITNAQDLLQVSPTDTALELTQRTAAVPDSPKVFFESLGTYGKTFARVVPSSAAEAKAQVQEMHALGVKTLDVSSDGTPYGKAIAAAVKADAPSESITVATSQSGADGFFYGSASPSAAATAVEAAVKANPAVKLFAPSALATTAFTSALSPAPANLYISEPGFAATKDLDSAGKQFVSAFQKAYGHAPSTQAIFGYAAMAGVLGVIEKAGSGVHDRATIVNDFFNLQDQPSVLGPYSIDPAGDTSIAPFVILHLKSGSLVPVASIQG